MLAQEAGPNGAGTFLIQWALFLCIWSIPLIIGEYAVGKATRSGIAMSFQKLGGQTVLWTGIFMSAVSTWIGFYYTAITGWCYYYLFYFIFNPLPTNPEESAGIWSEFQSSPWRILVFLGVVTICALICWKGIKSLERANAVLVPTLLIIILATCVWGLTLPGALSGLRFMFTPDFSQLLSPTSWISALSQNAWDTSAGYGAFLTYAVYLRAKDPTVKLGVITPVVNNIISLVCGTLVFSITFGLMESTTEEKLHVLKNAGPASTGLTFMWIPLLYGSVAPGRILTVRDLRSASDVSLVLTVLPRLGYLLSCSFGSSHEFSSRAD
jgi:neurotransmitter:Na+ symporter, NSS family